MEPEGYVLQDDAKRFWPREGVTMLPSKVEDAQVFTTRAAAEIKRREIHARNPKGPFPWVVIPRR